jgi:tetratricopeptide (TPR) repeat protein
MLIYMLKGIIPYKLSAYYPYPVLTPGSSYPVIYYLSPLILLGILFLIFKLSWKKNKTIVFGLAFFIVNIFLLLQLLPVGGSMMSERYTYLCYIGLFFIIGNSFSKMWDSSNKKISSYKYLFAFILVIYSTYLAYGTVQRNKVWKNSEVLWTNVIKQYPEAVIAYGNRGSYYQKANMIDIALADFNEALRLKPDHPETLINRSDVYRIKGMYKESIEDCNKALAAKKDFPGAYMNRGIAYCIVGRYDDAFADFGKVIAQDKNNSNVYCNRGNLYDMKMMFDSAISDYNNAIRLKPDYAEAFYNRGKTYMRKQNYSQAIDDFTKAIKFNSTYGEAYLFRSESYRTLKDYPKALDDIRTAQQMGKPVDPNYVKDLENLTMSNH